jgi:hypothetical protein
MARRLNGSTAWRLDGWLGCSMAERLDSLTAQQLDGLTAQWLKLLS